MPALITRARLESILQGARDRRVAIVGDAMLDVYLRGDVERISPEAPVPVVRVRERSHALGGAANVAQNVAAAGACSDLVATIGDDEAGAMLQQMLRALEAEVGALVRVSRPTTRKTRVVARAQQVVRFDEEEDVDLTGSDVERVIGAVHDAVARADALILEDYNKGVLVPPVIEAAMASARAKRIPVVVDPKYRNFFVYRGATIFKPNRRELESALGAAVDLEHSEALPETLRRLDAQHMVVTLGERGMVLVSASGERRRIPTTARDVYDVVGAGDTVTAYLATSLAAGASAHEAAIVANFAAGVEVGKPGAATVSPGEILEAYDGHAT
jgi:D-beta-D-heptose 7-phosphate kinase/D-beta-D-heptose 1-phosphate adenosyltransferase